MVDMDPYLRKLIGKANARSTQPAQPPPQQVDALTRDLRLAAEHSQNTDIRAAASVILERMQFLRQAGITFNGARDLYEVLGYDRLITNRQYRDRYCRGGIAGRIVDTPINATWRGEMEILEDKDKKSDTPFEKAWKSLDKRLKLRAKLQQVDRLAQLSTYAVLLIGVKGESDLAPELKKGRQNPDDIIFFSAFSGGGGPGGDTNSRALALDADCTIMEFDTDPASPRFALPLHYQLKRNDISSPAFFRPVHWSRIIHVADQCVFNEVYGLPALERVWNLLDDLEKVTGGGAEAFWLRANQGMHLDIDKDMSLPNTTEAIDSLKNQSEDYKHQITRWIRTRGVKATPLGSDVANFSAPSDAVLTQIAGSKAIPKRILTGSEMGELASSQDRDNWKDQVVGRQMQQAGPFLVRQLVDRLVEYNYVPPPARGVDEYFVVWPAIQTLTENERAEGVNKWASANATMKNAGMQPVFSDVEIRARWYDMPPLEEKEREAAMLPAPEPQQVPGQPAPGEPAFAAAEETEMARVLTAAIEANNTEVIHQILGLEHKLGSTQIDLPSSIADPIRAWGRKLPETELHSDGREENIHVTVKYGLPPSVTELDVRDAVRGTGQIRFTLAEMGVFEAEDYDVLYVKVTGSPELHALNQKIKKELGAADTHPTFKPHVTIAYLKPGEGKKYIGRTDFVGLSYAANEIVFSSSRDEKTVVSLAA